MFLFTGIFSKGEIGGTFDFVLKDNKIITATADLIHQNTIRIQNHK